MGAMKHLAMAKDHYAKLVSDDQDGYALLDHGRQTVDELNHAIIAEAVAAGMNLLHADDQAVFDQASYGGWMEDPQDSEHLIELADKAEAWLNDHVAPDGYAFGNDGELGAFGLWKIEDD